MKNNFLNKLEERKTKGILRKLDSFESSIDFFSNDYLGLSKIPFTVPLFGSTGSRLLSGNSIEAVQCENKIALFYGSEKALVYNSGYSLNVGFISCITTRHDLVLYDEKIHASIRDGIGLSTAKSFSFKHNNLMDLERQLKKNKSSNVFILIESLYSMTGNFSSLLDIYDLSKKYKAHLIVDEAHSIGVFGNQGKGLCYHYNIHDKVFARIITFGKAYGLMGAAVLSSKQTIDYLINFSRSFIYTTALPSSIYTCISNNIHESKINLLIHKLKVNLDYFHENFKHSLLISDTNSPIQIIQLSCNKKVSILSKKLITSGIFNKPIFSPTVPKNEECVRICFHAFNDKKEIDTLIRVLIANCP